MCGSFNWDKKKVCRHCGAKKTYAQAVSSPASHGSQTRSQESSGNTVSVQGHASTSQQSSSQTQPTPSTSRATISSRISTLEKARDDILSSDPSSEIAKSMEMEVTKLKREIVSNKSLGQQLDGRKGAIERAQKRRRQAQEQLEAANMAIEQETMELSRLEAELKRVEEAINSQQELPSATPIDTILNTMHEILVALQDPSSLDKELVASKVKQAISLSTSLPSDARKEQAPEPMQEDVPPPPEPHMAYGHRLRSKTGQ